MMKMQGIAAFQNAKCGTVYYIAPTKYEIGCGRCEKNLKFEEFRQHFEAHHVILETSAFQKSDLQEIDKKHFEALYANLEKRTLQKTETLQEMDMNSELEDEKPIEFVEVTLKSRIINAFIPEHTEEHDLITETIIGDKYGKRSVPKDISALKTMSDNGSSYDSSKHKKVILQNKCGAEAKETTFTCEFCRQTFKMLRSLKHHLKLNHSNKIVKQKTTKNKHKCELCGEIFGHAKYFKSHMWKHTGYVCTICGKTFTQLGNLHTHKKRHTGVKEYKCEQCDNSFYTAQELNAHVMKHTDSLPVVCEVCGRRFRNTGKLKAHMRRHTGERPATCGVCSKSFYSFHDLNIHSVTHTTDRPFTCDICNSSFQTKKALRVHKKLHITERNYKCEQCGKPFALASGLKAHMRVIHPTV